MADVTGGFGPLIGAGADTADESPRADDGLRTLSTRLRALQSYFKTANHPLTERELAEVTARDFTAEARVGLDALYGCAELLLTPSAEAPPWSLPGEGGPARAWALRGADLFGAGAPVRTDLRAVAESLSDLCLLGSSLVEGRRVNFDAWVALGRLVSRQVELCGAAVLSEHAYGTTAHAAVPPELLALAADISPDPLAADIGSIISRLFGLLELLGFVEGALVSDEPLRRALPFFTLLREESSAVLELIGARTLRIEGLDPAVHEHLDGTAYAMRMEMRKAFEHELVGLVGLRSATHVYAKVENAHGLLRDCFQQSITSIARAFDPALDGTLLFDTFRTKLEQSLLLRRELWGVLEAVRRAGDGRDADAHQALAVRLNAFRHGAMRLLMYKDWEALERFADELTAAKEASDLQATIHRLHAFVETLFSQVNMRAVLTDHPFAPPAGEQ